MSKIIIPFWVALFLSIATGAYAQLDDCQYTLADKAVPFDNSKYADWQSQGQAKVMQALAFDLAHLTVDKKTKEQLAETFTERAVYIKSLFEEEYFLFEDSLSQLVENIAEQLLEANEIRNEENVRFLIARSSIPNAACLGDGTIIINLGLISRLENFDQLAFVMAHELGHHHLDHVNHSIEKRVKMWSSSEFKNKIKSSRNQKIGANAELLELLKESEISLAKHSRAHELETDALGFDLYKKSGFPIEHAYSGLTLLKKLDLPKLNLPALNEVFNFKDLPWQEHWDDSHLSGLSLVALSEEEKELLRTHPQLTERIAQIKSLGADTLDQIEQELCELSIQYDLELLESRYDQGNIFGAFVLGLQLYNLNDKNVFVNETLANCLLDFVIARKEHVFSDVAPAPNRKFSEQSNLLATFLDNLSFKELVGIARNFIELKVAQGHLSTQSNGIQEKLNEFE